MPVVEWLVTVAMAFAGVFAVRRLRVRQFAEALREGRGRAAIGSHYERAPVPADDPFAPPPPAGVTVLGDLVQNSAGRPPMTMRWFVTPDGTTFGCVGSLQRVPLVRMLSTDGSTVWATLSVDKRALLAPSAPFVQDQRVGYRAGHDDGLRAHQEVVGKVAGLQPIRTLDELSAWLNAFNRRVADYRAAEDPQALLDFDLRRALGASYDRYAPALMRRLASSLPEAKLRA